MGFLLRREEGRTEAQKTCKIDFKMRYEQISGNGVALVTPFNEDLSIDFDSLSRIVNHVITAGADFLVVLGTTGETALLTLKERLAVIAFVKEVAANRVPIVLGYGGISTAELIEGFENYDYNGIDALLTVTPYYVKPTQKGLYEHYTALAAAAPRPIILYNVPGRTGINMEPATTLSLAKNPNIIGIKEASGKLFQIEEIIYRRPAGFKLYSGDDALTFHLVNAGADGVISVMANALPKEVCCIADTKVIDIDEAKDTHLKLKLLTKAVFADGNPCGIKYLLSKMGLCKNILRLPLVPVSEEVAQTIDAEYAAL